LTGVAYRITRSWTDAEDIAQDVWLRWANAHSDVDKPRNWLLRVTVRASLDRHGFHPNAAAYRALAAHFAAAL